MTNCRKRLSESECDKTLEEGHYKLVAINAKERESYDNVQTLNYAYIQSLEIIFGTLQLAA